MPEPLKNVYHPGFFEAFTHTAKQVIPEFRKQAFLNQVFDRNWQEMELKQRIRQIAASLHSHLPGSYPEQISLIQKMTEHIKKNGESSFPYLFFPEFIGMYGLEHLSPSLKAMEILTCFISCEFAIRPFIVHYPAEVMKQMESWSLHSDHHVRRLASEGCRPRLPWAMALPVFKKDPSPLFPILNNLKKDESLYVRKSVANNLNDIAKDHPDRVISLVQKWKGLGKETDWIIRHGCRTLLKKANPQAYQVFGLNQNPGCSICKLKLHSSQIRIGEELEFSFQLTNETKSEAVFRLEYVIHFNKANGKPSPKIFSLKEKAFQPGSYSIRKRQSFKELTTRRHYPGKHQLGIIVNGKEMVTKTFQLSK